MESIRLYLLGNPRVERDGLRIEFDTRKAIALLAFLAVSKRPHHRDTIAALLWPETDQKSARAALRRTLSVLRSGLGGEALVIQRDSLAWQPAGPMQSDIADFLQLSRRASEHNHPPGSLCTQCLQDLEKAAGIYQDHFMAGFSLRDSLAFDDWQFEQSEDFRRRLGQVLEQLAGGYAQVSRFEQAILHTRRWLSLDPLQEAAHRQLMLCLAWSDQRSAALQQYRECVRILERDLGVAPLEETTRLYQSILENRLPAILPKTVPTPLYAGEEPQENGLKPIDSPGAAGSVASGQAATPHLHFPLVGRSADSQTLLKIFNEARHESHWIQVSGEPGIGKTRLVEDFLDYVRGRGAKVLTGRCFPHENYLAFAPFSQALRSGLAQIDVQLSEHELSAQVWSEASRLLPELHSRFPQLPQAPTLTGAGAQSNFFASLQLLIIHLLSGELPGVLFLDDFHWADSASIQLFSYLVRRHQGSPLIFVTSCRDVDLPEGLHSLEHEAQRQGIFTRLPLNRLAPAYTRELVQYTLERTASNLDPGARQSLQEWLDQETEGLPFFIIEYLRAIPLNITRGPGGAKATSPQEWETPPGVQELIRSRLSGLDQATWQILTTAAVIGRSFDFDTLQEASGRSDIETLNGLERLLHDHLIEEIATGERGSRIQYDFTHDKLRQMVYEQTNAARRRLLHRRTADALQQQARLAGLSAPAAAAIAYHYAHGGLDQTAAEFYQQAGDYYRRIYALVEAIQQYQSALALGSTQPDELHEHIGEMMVLLGDYSAALRHLQSAAASASGAELARIEQAIGNLHHRRGEWELSASHFEAAEAILASQETSQQLASLYADWARTLQHTRQSQAAFRLANRALELAHETQDQQTQAKAENIIGMIFRINGEIEPAARHLQTSLQLAAEIQDLAVQVAAANNLALLYQQQGQLEKSVELTQQALAGCQKMGDRHRQAALLNHLADLHHLLGREQQAMELLKQAVVIFSDIGHQSGSDIPEIWMLTEW